jgi:O-antigen ligase
MHAESLRAPVALAALATLNVAVAVAVAMGRLDVGLVLALIPVVAVIAAAAIASNRAIFVFAVFAIDLSGVNPLRSEIIGGHVWASDLVLFGALIAWAGAWLIRPDGRRPAWPKAPILSLPLYVFAAFIAVGVVRGHVLWGLGYLSQPVRFVIYALIAFAVSDLTPRQAWQVLVAVFYLGAVVNAAAAVYYLATGTVQTDNSAGVSTGGVRVLTLTTALYLTGAVVLALLNFEREHRIGPRLLHLAVGGLAIFGIVVAYGRGVWFALTAVLVALFLTRRGLRRAVYFVLPLLLPLMIAGVFLLVHSDPGFVPRVMTRVTAVTNQDASIRWRQAANRAIWGQVQENPTFGIGFGKGATFVVDRARFDITQDPHDSYLFLWAGGGFVTLGAWLILYIVFLGDCWRRSRFQPELPRMLIAACVSIWFCFAADALTEPRLTQANSLLALWVLMLLPTTVPYRSRGEIGDLDAVA